MTQFDVGPRPLGVRDPNPNAFRDRKEQELRERTSFYEALGAGFDQEGLVTGIARVIDSSFGNGEIDPDFSIFGMPQEAQDNLFREIAPENIDAFAHARNFDHAFKIRRQVLMRQATQQIIADAGTAGTVATITAAVFDPASIAVGFGVGSLASAAARGSIGVAKLGTGVTRAQRLTSLSRRGLITGGAASATEAGAVETVVAASDPTADAADVAVAALFGMAFGGGLGALGGRVEMDSAMRRIRNAEVEAEWSDIRESGAELTPAGLQAFDDFVSGDHHRRFLAELGESLGIEEGDLATAQYLLDEESFSDVATRLIRGGVDEPERGVTYAMGAAGSGDIPFRGDFSRLPDAVRSVPDLVRRIFRGDTTPEQAVAELGIESADEDVTKAIRDAVEAREVNKLPGDFFIAGRITDRRTKYTAARFDTAGVFGSASDPAARMFGSAMVDDVVGGGPVQTEPVTRFVQRQINREARAVKPVLNDAYSAWARSRGTGWLKRQGNAGRQEFMELVSRDVRSPGSLGQNASQHVSDAADAIREQNKRLLGLAQRHGLLEDVPENENYLARLYSHSKILRLEEEHGEGAVVNLFRTAIGSSQDLDEDTLSKVATAMYRTVRNSKTSDLDRLTILRGGDRDIIRDTLEELQANGELQGLTADDVSRVAEVLSPDPAQTAGQPGVITARQRRRVELDEAAFDPETGLSFEDLLENNAESVQSNYAHQIIGASAVNEMLYAMSVELGKEIKTVEALRRELIRSGREAGEDVAKLYGVGRGNSRRSQFDYVMSWALGRNRFDNTIWRETATIARMHGMLTRGGTFGIAGLPELGRVAASGGLARISERIPGFRDLYRDARSGDATREQIDDMLDLTGTTGEINQHAYIARNDTFDDSVSDRSIGPNLTRVREAGRLASRRLSFLSGQAPIQQTLRNMAGHAYVRRWEKLAKRGRGIGKRRLEAIGIDTQTADRISDQIRTHGMDLDTWTDVRASSDFIASANRFVSNVVQTNDPGQLPEFLATPVGQTLFQFRSFTVGAYHGMLLRGVSIRDAEEGAMALMSMFFGGLAYIGQSYLRSLSQDDPQAYREERLSPDRVALAAFQRSGVSSLIPDAVNYGSMPFGISSPFDFRNSGLPTGVLANPTVDTLNDVLGISLVGEPAGGLTRSLGDGFQTDDFNRLQRLMPFGNLPVVQQALQALGGNVFEEPE